MKISHFPGSRFLDDADGVRDADADYHLFTGEAYGGSQDLPWYFSFLTWSATIAVDFVNWIAGDWLNLYEDDFILEKIDQVLGDYEDEPDTRFREAARFVDKVCNYANESSTITLTGHSLGAAEALEASYLLQNDSEFNGSKCRDFIKADRWSVRAYNPWLGTMQKRPHFLGDRLNTLYLNYSDLAEVAIVYALLKGRTKWSDHYLSDPDSPAHIKHGHAGATIYRTQPHEYLTESACSSAVSTARSYINSNCGGMSKADKKVCEQNAYDYADINRHCAVNCAGRSEEPEDGSIDEYIEQFSDWLKAVWLSCSPHTPEGCVEKNVYQHLQGQWSVKGERPIGNCNDPLADDYFW